MELHQVTVITPTKATLNKYGLSVDEWQVILERQGGKCGACGRVPSSERLATDHEHVRGWKAMPPEQRKVYVRGLLCYMCNHYRLARGATIENLRGAAQYLADYAKRKEEVKLVTTVKATSRSVRSKGGQRAA